MWLYLIAIVLLVVGLVGGVLTGGIFLIVFIPLGIIMLITAFATGAFARGAQHRGGQGGASTEREPLPHSLHESGPEAPATPENLADARREAQ